jgi:hypothetical protein
MEHVHACAKHDGETRTRSDLPFTLPSIHDPVLSANDMIAPSVRYLFTYPPRLQQHVTVVVGRAVG